MVTEKEILLIRRLLLEGAEELEGEWWIDDSGRATFDEGDVGDYTHAMITLEAALGISLDNPRIPEIIPMEPLSEEAVRFLKRIEASEDIINYLRKGADPRDYALKVMTWIRVKNNQFFVENFDNESLTRMSMFLHQKLEDDSGEIFIEELSSGRTWSVPTTMMMAGSTTVEDIKQQSGGIDQEDVLKYVAMISEDLIPRVMEVILEDETTGNVEKEYETRVDLDNLPDKMTDPSKIKQGLLFEKPGFSLRIRKETGEDEDPFYTMTCKFYRKSDEAEVEITKEMYDRLWPETISGTQMDKTRYKFGKWVVDDIRTPQSKKGIVAELETETEDEEVDIPEQFEVSA